MSTPLNTPVSSTGRRMALASSLLAGGIAIGSLFAGASVAGAQDADATTTESTATDATTNGRNGRGAHRFNDSEVLQEILGLTAEEFQAEREAGSTLVDIADAQGVSESDLVAALVTEATTRLADAVESGDIDAERAAEITEGLEERITERVNQVPGERDGSGHRGGGAESFNGEVLAGLGLDTDALAEAMESGSTLAEAAAAQGVSEADLVAGLTASAQERLTTAVEEGKIDEDKAAEIEAGIAERIESTVDSSELGRQGQRRPGNAPDAAADGDAPDGDAVSPEGARGPGGVGGRGGGQMAQDDAEG